MLNLTVRLRTLHGQHLYWLYRIVDAGQILYYDIHAPTGYGFNDRDVALKMARTLEEEHKNAVKKGNTDE